MARRPTYRELEQKIRTLEEECAKGKQATEEQKRVEELIHQREEKYHTILETAMDGFWVADVEGRILEVNDAFCRMSGYSKEELQAMHIGNLEAAETADDIAAHGRKIMAQGEDRFESRHRRKDGSIIEVEVSILYRPMEGGRFIGFFRDITERKQTEDALRKAERQLKLVLDTVPAMIWQKDLQGKYIMVNRALCQTAGLPEEDYLGKTDHDLYEAELADQFVSVDRRIHLSGEPEFGLEEEQRKPSGEQMWWSVDKIAYRDADDRVAGTVGFALDITAEKKTKEVLRESEERFRFLAENMADMVWTMDLYFRLTYVSPSITKVLGFSPEERKRQPLEERVTPEFVERFRRFLEEVCGSGAIDSDPYRSATLEFESYRKDGSTVWIENNMKAIRDQKGSVIGILGVSRDITDRRRAEKAALHRKNTELNSFINNIPDLAWIKDSESKFIAVNNAFARTVGMPSELLISNTCKVSSEDDAGRKSWEDDREVMENKKQTITEEEIVDSRNNRIWLETIKSPILDDSGKVLGTVGIARDITDRIRAKEVLEQSERKLRFLSSHLLSAHEAERNRIAKELHDQLGQDLIGLKLHVGSIQRRLNEGKEVAVSGEFENVKEDIDQIIENVRRLSRDLGPHALEHLGLWQALRYLTEELTKHYLVKTSFDIVTSDNRLSQDAQLNIFRVFQEALTNIRKHAGAAHVSIEVSENDDHFSFWIEDDGRGFNLTQATEGNPTEKGLGLVIMEERIRSLGGVFGIWSQEGKGTRINFTVPGEK